MDEGDRLSRAALAALDRDHAELLARDDFLREEAWRLGVDLDGILRNLSLDAGERLHALSAGLPELGLDVLCHQLCRRGIRFVLIGGLAGSLYGSNHPTADFDLCHARDEDNLRSLADLLRTIGAVYRRAPQFAAPELHEATLATEMDFVFTTPHGKFDLIGQLTGVGTYTEASEGAVDIAYRGMRLPVIALPKLISSKQSTQRDKDARVANELRIVALALQRAALAPQA